MRVVMAMDGSADARDAVEWLVQAPLPAATHISVITAILVPAAYEALEMAWSQLRTEAEEVAEQARRRLAAHWPDTAAHVVEGEPRSVIIRAAEHEDADLIVVGARGLGAVATFLLGSVSLGVAREAPCPVLVCKGAPRAITSITVAVDGSAHARAALRFVSRLPLPAGASLHLVSVAEPLRFPSTAPSIVQPRLRAAMHDYEDASRRKAEEVLRAAAAEIPSGRPVTTTGALGPIAPSIIAEAEKQASDLIVVGARGLGAVKRVLLGSVSETVLRHARCPVLVVHPTERA